MPDPTYMPFTEVPVGAVYFEMIGSGCGATWFPARKLDAISARYLTSAGFIPYGNPINPDPCLHCKLGIQVEAFERAS